MKRKPINKISKKQQEKLYKWRGVVIQKMQHQVMERGFAYCEICMLPEKNWEGGKIWGHHIDKDRNNNTLENCELAHYICHVNKYHGGMSYEA